MIRHMLYKVGALRAAVAVGVPFLIASSAFAQVGGTQPTPAAAAATPAVGTGAGTPTDSALADAAADTNAGAGAATTERVVVTGSYIPTAETESALPVTVYTATVLQKQGAQTPAEGLRQLPSFVGNTVTENDSNGGNGSAFVNLRALGTGNTLILVNGRRAFGYSNINAIGIGSLSRTEVLKDGASAIYGSDAVAGVVNFILLNGPGEAPYEGAEIDMLYGNTTDKDARVLHTWIRGGVATDKFSVAAAGEYYDREDIFSRDREIAVTADQRSLGGINQSSPTYSGRVSVTARPGQPSGQLTLINTADNQVAGRQDYRQFDPGGFGTDQDRFNFRLFTPSIPGMEKYNTYLTARYKVFGEALQIYGDIMYSKQKQDNGLAPSPFTIPLARYGNASVRPPGFESTGIVGGPSPAQQASSIAGQRAVIRNSPFNPFGNDLLTLRYRLVQELGNRRSFFDFDYYRYVAGANGNFTFTDNNAISFLGYDSGVLYEENRQLEINSGDATRGGIYNEILAGNFNPFIGQNAPVAGNAPTFAQVGGQSVPTGETRPYDNTAAAQRSSFLARSYDYLIFTLWDAKVFGNLFPNLYQGGIGFNIGGEYRTERFYNDPDDVLLAGDQLGFNQASRSDFKTEVVSGFGELQIPIITSAMNIPGARSLELQVAARYEEFELHDRLNDDIPRSRFDNGVTPRVSLRYQPYADLTLRASYGQSFLSPSAGQLFAPEAQNFPTISDPVGGFLQPANGVIQSGNRLLVPEETDTYTAGLVFTPKFLPGFTLTADVYQVYTTGVILGAADFAQLAVTANGNFIQQGGNPADAPFADIIERDISTGGQEGAGIVTQVISQSQNAGKRLVNGLDMTAAYQLPTQSFGTFTLSAGYNYFFTWKAEPIGPQDDGTPGVGTTSFLGNFTTSLPLAPGAIPYHKGFLRGEYEWKGLNFVSTLNYVSSYNDDSSVLAPVVLGQVEVGGTPTNPQYPIYRRVSDYITLDLQLRYEFVKPEAEEAAAGFSKDAKGGKAMQTSVAGVEQGSFFQRVLWGTSLRVGVNNVFDRNPPTTLGAFNDNYDTSLYTIRNRYYYVGINKKF